MSSIDLQVGDIVVDQVTGNIGVLVERVLLTNNGVDDALALWAWEMYWIGANVPPGERSNMWTEFGLESIIKTGTYRYHRS